MIPAWARLYTNPRIPYAELKCWALVKRIQREHNNGLEVFDFYDEFDRAEDACWEKGKRIDSIVLRELALGSWEKVTRPALFDVALYRIDGHLSHAGIVVDERHGITSTERHGSHWYRLGIDPWAQMLEGYYRHRPPRQT